MASPASRIGDGQPPIKRAKLEVPDDLGETSAVAPGTVSTIPAPGPSLAHVYDWVKHRWEQIVQEYEHPLQYLRDSLKSKEAKKEFCKSALKAMLAAHPDMRATCMSKVDLKDAMQSDIGCSSCLGSIGCKA